MKVEDRMYRPVFITVLTCGAALAAVQHPAPMPVIPSGTNITCRVDRPFDTNRDAPGTAFVGQTTADLVYKGGVLVPRGAVCRGHLVQSKSSGRLKGRARMQLSLDALQVRGHEYPVSATSPVLTSKNHKKHNLKWIGGGGGVGTVIGAIAGGGVGALVGAGAGAAAGTGGAALTGKKDVYVPPESLFVFSLKAPWC
jgi:hypothetical protein